MTNDEWRAFLLVSLGFFLGVVATLSIIGAG